MKIIKQAKKPQIAARILDILYANEARNATFVCKYEVSLSF